MDIQQSAERGTTSTSSTDTAPSFHPDDHAYLSAQMVSDGEEEMSVLSITTLKAIEQRLGLRFNALRKSPRCRFLVEVKFWQFAAVHAYEVYKESLEVGDDKKAAKKALSEELLLFLSEESKDQENSDAFAKVFARNAAMLLTAPAYLTQDNGMWERLRAHCRTLDEWVPSEELHATS